MNKDSHRYLKWIGFVISVVLLPLIISLIANFTTWFSTKDRVEITFKLEGWITIGSIKSGDLQDLQLLLASKPVKNILKVSWTITNTGNKGIGKFESGPFIEFPQGLNIISAKVSETSEMLKISSNVIIENNYAKIDSLGIFNPSNYFRVDFYLKDVDEPNITSKYFEVWKLEGKALDLNISRDISVADKRQISYIEIHKILPQWFWIAYIVFIGIIAITITRRILSRML